MSGRIGALLVALAGLMAGVACASGEPESTQESRVAAVWAAVDATRAVGLVGFSAATSDVALDGQVDLATGEGEVVVSAPRIAGTTVPVSYRAARDEQVPSAIPANEVAAVVPDSLDGSGRRPGNPLVALDTVASVAKVRSFGGQAVRGVPAFRYEVVTDAGTPADVWIDDDGLLRRIQLGIDLTTRTSTTDPDHGLPRVVTVDFFNFGGGRLPAEE